VTEAILYDYLTKAVAWLLSTVVAAWAAFKFIPQKWLEHKLEERLEQQRAAYATELQEARFKLDTELQQARHRLDVALRKTPKIQEKEFEVFSRAWEQLNEAIGHAALVVSPLQTYPDFSQMTAARVETFIKNSPLDEVDREEFSRAADKGKFYHDRIFYYRLRKAKDASTALHRTIKGNSIFLEPEIRARFERIDELAWGVLVNRELGQQVGDPKVWIQAATKFNNEAEPLRKEIEELVQKRLGFIEK
jgi:hypothetical protein